MPVLAHAEKDHIEARDFTSLEMKFFAQQFLVLKGGFHGVLIAAHTEKLGAGNVVQELAAGNGIRGFEGCSDFSRQWCVDFCSERLGEAFDPASCELVWQA